MAAMQESKKDLSEFWFVTPKTWFVSKQCQDDTIKYLSVIRNADPAKTFCSTEIEAKPFDRANHLNQKC